MKEATAALKLALVAMETIIPDAVCSVVHHPREDQHERGEPCPISQRFAAALIAIKEALAPTSTQCEVQDEQSSSQEPVATVTSESGNPDVKMSWWHEPALTVGTKLYTTPPKEQRSCDKRPWVGLTATAKLDLLSTAKGVGGRINGDAQLLELLNEHETQLKRKNT